jgi:hypothetical protein
MPERMRDDMSKKCGTPDKMRDKLPDEILDKMPMPIKCKINIYNIYIYSSQNARYIVRSNCESNVGTCQNIGQTECQITDRMSEKMSACVSDKM